MATPRKHTDADGDKRRALRQVEHTAGRADAADAALRGAIRLASSTGASLREIAENSGMSHTRVQRILERET